MLRNDAKKFVKNETQKDIKASPFDDRVPEIDEL